MANKQNLSGEDLNDQWGVGAKHSLYREDGKWYHRLRRFPGVLFDANGYVIFKTEKDYFESPYLQIQQEVHVPNGISSMPKYIRISETDQFQSISRCIKKVSDGKKQYKIANLPKGQQGGKRSLGKVDRIIRNTRVSEWVKYIHEWRCQICGITLELSAGRLYAEGHHIKPLGGKHNGPDVTENVLCVCPEHHVLLDYGVIALSKFQLLMVDGHEISEDYIRYHNTNIYQKVS